ncbi:hypothetical protein Hrd1104_06095 [Halorhabdus sp. CBA1104]|nr:hypothetical protein Hrd1104_06095 [Halorhabdus sp. CBA1104]
MRFERMDHRKTMTSLRSVLRLPSPRSFAMLTHEDPTGADIASAAVFMVDYLNWRNFCFSTVQIFKILKSACEDTAHICKSI